MKVKYAELLGPLFLGNKNFATKLDTNRQAGLSLTFDERERWLVATFNGQVGYIPLSNVAAMIEDDGARPSVSIKQQVVGGKIKAQVSTPTGIRND